MLGAWRADVFENINHHECTFMLCEIDIQISDTKLTTLPRVRNKHISWLTLIITLHLL